MRQQRCQAMPSDLLNESHSACRRAFSASRCVAPVALLWSKELKNPFKVFGRAACDVGSRASARRCVCKPNVCLDALSAWGDRLARRLLVVVLVVLPATLPIAEAPRSLPDFNLAANCVRVGAGEAATEGCSTRDAFSGFVRLPRMASSVLVADIKGGCAADVGG